MLYENWYAMSDKALAEHLGKFIKEHRVRANVTQEALAKEAGISRPTLHALESGDAVTTTTLIQVLRVLEQLHIFRHLTIEPQESPMLLAEKELNKPKRVRGSKPNQNTSYVDW